MHIDIICSIEGTCSWYFSFDQLRSKYILFMYQREDYSSNHPRTSLRLKPQVSIILRSTSCYSDQEIPNQHIRSSVIDQEHSIRGKLSVLCIFPCLRWFRNFASSLSTSCPISNGNQLITLSRSPSSEYSKYFKSLGSMYSQDHVDERYILWRWTRRPTFKISSATAGDICIRECHLQLIRNPSD